MVSAVDSGTSDPDSIPDQGHCNCVLGQDTYSASLQPGVQIGSGKFNAVG